MNKYKVGDWVETINLEIQDEILHDGMVGVVDEVLDVDDYKYHVAINGSYGTFLESELKLKKQLNELSFDERFVSYNNLQHNRDDCEYAYKAVAASQQQEIESSYKIGYQEGFGSRQAEVDNLQCDIDELKHELETLQGMYNAVSLTAGELVDERDVLQKRIDEALDHTINHGGSDDLAHIINILKGKV